MLEDDLIDVSIPDEFLELCSGWAGDTGCMLRAIDSTGDLTLGSRRPYNDDVARYLTDWEWHIRLWSNLSSDVAYVARLAEKSSHEDAEELRRFETFADETVDSLRVAYELQESEAV